MENIETLISTLTDSLKVFNEASGTTTAPDVEGLTKYLGSRNITFDEWNRAIHYVGCSVEDVRRMSVIIGEVVSVATAMKQYSDEQDTANAIALTATFTDNLNAGIAALSAVVDGKLAALNAALTASIAENSANDAATASDLRAEIGSNQQTFERFERDTTREFEAVRSEYVEYVDTKVADLVDGAPEALDTLREIAEALKEDDSAIKVILEKVAEVEGRIEESEKKVNEKNVIAPYGKALRILKRDQREGPDTTYPNASVMVYIADYSNPTAYDRAKAEAVVELEYLDAENIGAGVELWLSLYDIKTDTSYVVAWVSLAAERVGISRRRFEDEEISNTTAPDFARGDNVDTEVAYYTYADSGEPRRVAKIGYEWVNGSYISVLINDVEVHRIDSIPLEDIKYRLPVFGISVSQMVKCDLDILSAGIVAGSEDATRKFGYVDFDSVEADENGELASWSFGKTVGVALHSTFVDDDGFDVFKVIDVDVSSSAAVNRGYLEGTLSDYMQTLEALDRETLRKGGVDVAAFEKLTREFNRIPYIRSWRDNNKDKVLESSRGLYPKMTSTQQGELASLPRNYDEGETHIILGSIPERLGSFLNDDRYAGHIFVREDVPPVDALPEWRKKVAAPVKYVDAELEKRVPKISRVDGYDSVYAQGNGGVKGVPAVYDYDVYKGDAIPVRRASDNTIRANTPEDAGNRCLANVGYVKNRIAELVNGAPEQLNTIKELADAYAENKDIVEALTSAIGETEKKVNKALGIPTEGLAYEYYKYNTTEYYICTGIGTATDTEIIVANEINGLPVKEINWDSDSTTVSIHIPPNVDTIRGFNNCSALEKVYIPKTVTTVGGYLFENCPKLTLYTEYEEFPGYWNEYGNYIACSNVEYSYVSDFFSLNEALDEKLNKNLLLSGVENPVATPTLRYTTRTVDGKSVIVCNSYSSSGVGPADVVIKDGTEILAMAAFNGTDSDRAEFSTLILPDSMTTVEESAVAPFLSRPTSSIYIPKSVTTVESRAFQPHVWGSQVLTIICEADSKPEGWADDWLYTGYSSGEVKVVWGYAYNTRKLNEKIDRLVNAGVAEGRSY